MNLTFTNLNPEDHYQLQLAVYMRRDYHAEEGKHGWVEQRHGGFSGYTKFICDLSKVNPNNVFWVWAGNEIVGQVINECATDFRPEQGRIQFVYISPEYRRRGFGRIMLDEAARRLHKAGFTKLWLNTPRDNVRNMSFYKAQGWTLSDETPPEKPHLAIWEKQLA